MKNLFEAGRAEEMKSRIARLRSDSERQWGKMNPAQAMAHCAGGLEMGVGDSIPPRILIGRVLGGFIKPKALGDDAPMRKHSPTVPVLVMHESDRDLEREKVRVTELIDRFVAAGPAGCTKHPHSFFGQMTPEEWAILMYKHLDHHLRQFGV
ncbi:MAG: DUF1569 domain-containing protein [Gemmatimonadaceae bacterium]|nr:DUF1569 domain-containing protein [Gemmatimonadaceae bacterium]